MSPQRQSRIPAPMSSFSTNVAPRQTRVNRSHSSASLNISTPQYQSVVQAPISASSAGSSRALPQTPPAIIQEAPVSSGRRSSRSTAVKARETIREAIKSSGIGSSSSRASTRNSSGSTGSNDLNSTIAVIPNEPRPRRVSNASSPTAASHMNTTPRGTKHQVPAFVPKPRPLPDLNSHYDVHVFDTAVIHEGDDHAPRRSSFGRVITSGRNYIPNQYMKQEPIEPEETGVFGEAEEKVNWKLKGRTDAWYTTNSEPKAKGKDKAVQVNGGAEITDPRPQEEVDILESELEEDEEEEEGSSQYYHSPYSTHQVSPELSNSPKNTKTPSFVAPRKVHKRRKKYRNIYVSSSKYRQLRAKQKERTEKKATEEKSRQKVRLADSNKPNGVNTAFEEDFGVIHRADSGAPELIGDPGSPGFGAAVDALLGTAMAVLDPDMSMGDVPGEANGSIIAVQDQPPPLPELVAQTNALNLEQSTAPTNAVETGEGGEEMSFVGTDRLTTNIENSAVEMPSGEIESTIQSPRAVQTLTGEEVLVPEAENSIESEKDQPSREGGIEGNTNGQIKIEEIDDDIITQRERLNSISSVTRVEVRAETGDMDHVCAERPLTEDAQSVKMEISTSQREIDSPRSLENIEKNDNHTVVESCVLPRMRRRTIDMELRGVHPIIELTGVGGNVEVLGDVSLKTGPKEDHERSRGVEKGKEKHPPIEILLAATHLFLISHQEHHHQQQHHQHQRHHQRHRQRHHQAAGNLCNVTKPIRTISQDIKMQTRSKSAAAEARNGPPARIDNEQKKQKKQKEQKEKGLLRDVPICHNCNATLEHVEEIESRYRLLRLDKKAQADDQGSPTKTNANDKNSGTVLTALEKMERHISLCGAGVDEFGSYRLETQCPHNCGCSLGDVVDQKRESGECAGRGDRELMVGHMMRCALGRVEDQEDDSARAENDRVNRSQTGQVDSGDNDCEPPKRQLSAHSSERVFDLIDILVGAGLVPTWPSNTSALVENQLREVLLSVGLYQDGRPLAGSSKSPNCNDYRYIGGNSACYEIPRKVRGLFRSMGMRPNGERVFPGKKRGRDVVIDDHTDDNDSEDGWWAVSPRSSSAKRARLDGPSSSRELSSAPPSVSSYSSLHGAPSATPPPRVSASVSRSVSSRASRRASLYSRPVSPRASPAAPQNAIAVSFSSSAISSPPDLEKQVDGGATRFLEVPDVQPSVATSRATSESQKGCGGVLPAYIAYNADTIGEDIKVMGAGLLPFGMKMEDVLFPRITPASEFIKTIKKSKGRENLMAQENLVRGLEGYQREFSELEDLIQEIEALAGGKRKKVRTAVAHRKGRKFRNPEEPEDPIVWEDQKEADLYGFKHDPDVLRRGDQDPFAQRESRYSTRGRGQRDGDPPYFREKLFPGFEAPGEAPRTQPKAIQKVRLGVVDRAVSAPAVAAEKKKVGRPPKTQDDAVPAKLTAPPLVRTKSADPVTKPVSKPVPKPVPSAAPRKLKITIPAGQPRRGRSGRGDLGSAGSPLPAPPLTAMRRTSTRLVKTADKLELSVTFGDSAVVEYRRIVLAAPSPAPAPAPAEVPASSYFPAIPAVTSRPTTPAYRGKPRGRPPGKGRGGRGNGRGRGSNLSSRMSTPMPEGLELRQETPDLDQSPWGVGPSVSGPAPTMFGVFPSRPLAPAQPPPSLPPPSRPPPPPPPSSETLPLIFSDLEAKKPKIGRGKTYKIPTSVARELGKVTQEEEFIAAANSNLGKRKRTKTALAYEAPKRRRTAEGGDEGSGEAGGVSEPEANGAAMLGVPEAEGRF